MEVIYYFDKGRLEKEKAVVESIYGKDIIYISDRPEMIADKFMDGDFLICNSVDELAATAGTASDIETIVRVYMNILNRGTELIFDRSTQCNSLFIKTLISSDSDFEEVLRKCVGNYHGQRDIAAKYAKKHVVTAKANGNKVGIKKGTKLVTKKSVIMKQKIKELSKDYNGTLNDEELIKQLGIARNSYYKYKRELKEEEQ
jgi:hypothetical protein